MSSYPIIGLLLITAPLASGCGGDGPHAGPSRQVPVDLQFTLGINLTETVYVGQSVTVPGTGLVRQIRFSWYDADGAVAFGKLCILGQEYLGTPHDLGPGQPRFVAWSQETTNREYVFAADVLLQGGTRYWFYASEQGNILTDTREGAYPGGDLYRAIPIGFFFAKSPIGQAGPNREPPRIGFSDANFRLQGVGDSSSK